MHKRSLLAAMAGLSITPLLRAAVPPMQRVGVFSLLGDSVRIVARDTREALFKDVGMDDIVFDVAGRSLQAHQPSLELRHFRAPREVDVDDQIAIGTAAGRRGELPAWMGEAVREASLSHVLLIASDVGRMEFRTGGSDFFGVPRTLAGVGFYVSADMRWKNWETGVTHSGFLGPFVQLRMTLLEARGPQVVRSVEVRDGFVSGPSQSEATDPWKFMDRPQKAAALQGLLRTNIARAMQGVLTPT